MKFISLSLLTVFCTLFIVQLACAAGLQVHVGCSASPTHHDHAETCHWDPCGQDYHSPTKTKRVDMASDFLPVTDDLHSRMMVDLGSRLITPRAPNDISTPRPTSNDPLLN